MVNDKKLKRKIPSLLIDTPAYGDNPEYQHKTRAVERLQRKQPTVFHELMQNISIAIDELDRAAEEAGFQQVDFKGGKIVRYYKYRKQNRN